MGTVSTILVREGWGGPGALGPGEAAHLAVAGARLVHEGAVLTGPHGGRGSVRGTPDSAVLVEARKLHPNCACGWGEKQVSIISAQGDSALWDCYSRWSESGLCPGRQQMRLESPATELLCAELQAGGNTHLPRPLAEAALCEHPHWSPTPHAGHLHHFQS